MAATVHLPGDRVVLHLMANAYWKGLRFEVPPVGQPGGPWRRCVDTLLDSPDDIYDWAEGPVVQGSTYLIQPRSVVFLATKVPGREAAEHPPEARTWKG